MRQDLRDIIEGDLARLAAEVLVSSTFDRYRRVVSSQQGPLPVARLCAAKHRSFRVWRA